jgi:hypothetical protein
MNDQPELRLRIVRSLACCGRVIRVSYRPEEDVREAENDLDVLVKFHKCEADE